MKVKNYGSRKDANHREITKHFEDLCCKVKDVTSVPGFCDLIVKTNGQIALVEIKDPLKSPSQQALTKAEQDFHDYWGKVHIVKTYLDVVALVNCLRTR